VEAQIVTAAVNGGDAVLARDEVHFVFDLQRPTGVCVCVCVCVCVRARARARAGVYVCDRAQMRAGICWLPRSRLHTSALIHTGALNLNPEP